MPFEKKTSMDYAITELMRRVNDDTKRLRLLEQRSVAMDSRVASLEQTLLEQFKKVNQAFDRLSQKIDESNDRIAKIEDDTKKLVRQMDRVASKTELREIQGFIDLINPIKSNFVTKPEIERMLKEKLGK